jgi:hypothetical protein
MPSPQKVFLCTAKCAPLSLAVHFGSGRTIRGVVGHILRSLLIDMLARIEHTFPSAEEASAQLQSETDGY